MTSVTFMLGGALFFFLLTCSTAEVATDELKAEILKELLRELSDDEDKKSNDEETRIIGGTDLGKGDHPWLVSLQAEIPTRTFLGITITSKKLHCGGSLIRRDVVLTAAHCFVNAEIGSKARIPKYWTARLGEIDRESGFFDDVADFFGDVIGNDDWRTWEIEGKQIIVHDGYNENEHWLNDIAILKLKEAVPFEEVLVGQVSLPAQGDSVYPIPGNMCLGIGWGCKKKGGQVADVAQKVELMALSAEKCRYIWGVSMDTRLCAGEEEQGKGICSGDSGGPLMCKRNGNWYQAGIASFASAKSPESYPGVFTRVSSYRTWIEENIKD